MAHVDAPAFRIWPPVALGLPLAAGLVISAWVGDPVPVATTTTRWVGWALVVGFGLWNGWTLAYMSTHRTAVLPGAATVLVLQTGPFRLSRNPLYVGLIALDVGWALLADSFWALLFVPIGVAALWWGAVRPEERYLSEKFGAEYDSYRTSVRRWL